MRFGLALPQYGFSLPSGEGGSWGAVRDWAQRAEDLGFDSVWLSDHLFLDLERYGGSTQRHGAIECLSGLAGLAVATSRVKIGALVVCNDLRPPTVVAKTASTIDVLSGGRLELGIGAGWYAPDFEAAGVEFAPPGRRLRRLAEAVQVIRGMLSNETFTFDGRYYQVDEAHNIPRSSQSARPRVWVGGKGDTTVSIAGRFADGYNAVWAWTPEAFADRIRVLERTMAESGRAPKEVARSVGLYALVAEDESAVDARFDRYLAASPIIPPAKTAADWGHDKLAGTPEQVVDRIKQFEALGVEEVILGVGMLPFQIAEAEAVDDFASLVFPEFKQANQSTK